MSEVGGNRVYFRYLVFFFGSSVFSDSVVVRVSGIKSRRLFWF